MPWIIAGDFNEVFAEGDKFGGRSVCSNKSLLFKEVLDCCNMIDMGFVGPRFTWTNKQNVNALVQERIDRFFVNPKWYGAHPDARVTHLTRCVFDHCLVLLESNPSTGVFLPRPFKFHSVWLLDLSFPRIVMDAWGQSHPLWESIENFSKKATNRNRNHFGNIFGKKKRVMARLNGIQKAISIYPSHSLLKLEKELLLELNVLLNQEEEFWVQNSRINRLVEGDRNTAFHHLTTMVRRRRNKFSCIINDLGEWIQSEVGTMNFIRGGFEKLFTTSLESSPFHPSRPSKWQAVLTEEERSNLGAMVTDVEIKDGLWALKAFKAPGPDGLHAGFSQRFWFIVGNLVKAEVKKAFIECKIPDYLNRTNIVLIPKIAGLEKLGNYCPICLCNTVYKMVTKIIVARIRPYLDKLVFPLQSAFVLGRRSVDNAIVVQELIHTISSKKCKVGYMAIKVELEKAYDKVEWSFIREVLINANLPQNLVSLIMSCVSSVSTSILFNGGNMEPIFPHDELGKAIRYLPIYSSFV